MIAKDKKRVIFYYLQNNLEKTKLFSLFFLLKTHLERRYEACQKNTCKIVLDKSTHFV